MRNANELHAEHADIDYVARLNAMHQSIAKQVMFLQLALSQSGGEVGTVNRDVEFLQDVRERAEVVLVPVSQNNGGDVLAILFKEIEVRNTNVDAIGRLFRKPHAGVEDNHFILVTHRHAIHSKLAYPTERNDL